MQTKVDSEVPKKVKCQKCGEEGHHARECSKQLWCEICRKDTHVAEKCVWPKQTKPVMPIVGLAVDGMGFFSAQHARAVQRKTKKTALGLVKVLEGNISASELELAFRFHFSWGKIWHATQCTEGFLLQFQNKERLEELANFLELKLKYSEARVMVLSWNSQTRAKAKLHTIWMIAENVPEEMLNYHGACEIGTMLGAVDEVDKEALDGKEMVRIKVCVKSISKLPPVLELAVKPFLYDIFFKIESVVEEGWNATLPGGLGKRGSVDINWNLNQEEKSGKKMKNGESNFEDGSADQGDIQKKDEETDDTFLQTNDNNGKTVPMMIDEEKQVGGESNEQLQGSLGQLNSVVDQVIAVCDLSKKDQSEEVADSQDSEGKLKIEDSLVDDSQDSSASDFARRVNGIMQNSQDSVSGEPNDAQVDDFLLVKRRKGKEKIGEVMEATRRSSRLGNDDQKVADKATERTEAKNAFINAEREPKRDGGARKQTTAKNCK